jgi:hypothetical protein
MKNGLPGFSVEFSSISGRPRSSRECSFWLLKLIHRSVKVCLVEHYTCIYKYDSKESVFVCYHFFVSVYKDASNCDVRTMDRMKKLRRKACVSFRCSDCLSLSLLSNLSRQKGTPICLMFFRLFLAAVRYINCPCRKVQSLSKCTDFLKFFFFLRNVRATPALMAAHCCYNDVARCVRGTVLHFNSAFYTYTHGFYLDVCTVHCVSVVILTNKCTIY